jgi:type I restriction enzyme S subunit
VGLQTFFDNFAVLADAPNGVSKLRDLALQLAIRGQLGTQNNKDELAVGLAQKIQLQRARLIRNKEIKNSKQLPPIQSNEIFFAIPDKWQWMRLGEIGDWGAGATPDRKNSKYYGGKIRWFKSGELNDGYICESEETVTELALKECSLRLNKPGDVLIAMYGATIGKLAILETEATTNQAVCACTSFNGFYNRFLFVVLRAYKSHFTGRGTGGAQPNISREKIIHTVAPLPPLEEQNRIVTKVDELMRLCDELEARQQAKRKSRARLNSATLAPLNNAASLAQDEFAQASTRLAANFSRLYDSAETVAALRSTMLQLALQGKLIPQDPSDEPASSLLEKVNKEKKRLVKEGKIANRSPLPEIQHGEKGFELPYGWSWARLGDFVDYRLGKMLDKSKNKGKPCPYLRNTNVQWLRFDLSDVKEMRFEDSELEEYEVKRGDLLICEGGEPGRCAIWDAQIQQIMFQKAIHRVRPFANINSWFLLYSFLGDAMTGNLDKHFTGATIKHLTGQQLAKYVVGLPPVAEQKRIVAKVNQLMTLCEELEAKLRQAKADSEKLMNAAVQHVLGTISNKEENRARICVGPLTV